MLISVFQIQAAVLLTIESLVLNVPALSSSFRGDVLHLADINVKIRDPSERGGLAIDCFLAFDGVKAPRLALGRPGRTSHGPSGKRGRRLQG